MLGPVSLAWWMVTGLVTFVTLILLILWPEPRTREDYSMGPALVMVGRFVAWVVFNLSVWLIGSLCR